MLEFGEGIDLIEFVLFGKVRGSTLGGNVLYGCSFVLLELALISLICMLLHLFVFFSRLSGEANIEKPYFPLPCHCSFRARPTPTSVFSSKSYITRYEQRLCVLYDFQDTYVPFITAASKKLEAVPEADGEASPDEPGAKPDLKTEEEGEEAGEDETKGDGTKPTTESETIQPAGEGQETSTVEPMSQEENLGGLDEILEGSVAEPMSQEGALSELEGEPMSQSAGEERQENSSTGTTANVPAEDDMVGRKRSAEQPAGDDAQSKSDQGAEMETNEHHIDGAQAGQQGQKEGEEETAASGNTCDSSAPKDER